jgi:hypothetical protein
LGDSAALPLYRLELKPLRAPWILCRILHLSRDDAKGVDLAAGPVVKVSGPHVAFPALFGLVEELSLRASETVRKQIKSARQMAPWLSLPPVEDGRKILIGGPGRAELLTQIAECLPTKKADDLVICSSSFDRELNGMPKLLPLSMAKPVPGRRRRCDRAGQLGEKVWPQTTEERPESRFKCLLSAIAAMESGYRLSLASGEPSKNSRLALSDRCTARPSATTALHREGDSFVAHSVKSDDAFRFGWIVSESGDALSNPVGITWPSVGSQRRAGGSAGTKAGDYVGAMQDGAVLGTVLFELLDQFRDFEVIKIGSGKRSGSEKKKGEQDKGATEQPGGFFYTDAKADAVNGHHWTGDRIDLDILASLVQPLSPIGGGQTLKH